MTLFSIGGIIINSLIVPSCLHRRTGGIVESLKAHRIIRLSWPMEYI